MEFLDSSVKLEAGSDSCICCWCTALPNSRVESENRSSDSVPNQAENSTKIKIHYLSTLCVSGCRPPPSTSELGIDSTVMLDAESFLDNTATCVTTVDSRPRDNTERSSIDPLRAAVIKQCI